MKTADEFGWDMENWQENRVLLIRTRDAEWQARVDAARREGWEAGIRAGMQEMRDSFAENRLVNSAALIATGPPDR